jgi:hypothetical protein
MHSGTVRLPYFRAPERINALRSALHGWRGTRWQHAGNRPNEMKCGITGDCLFWVKVFKEIGALPSHLEIPPYRKMEAAADKMKLLRTRIEGTGLAELVFECPSAQVPTNSAAHTLMHSGTDALMHLLPGDVLLFRNGMSGVHCGLVVKSTPVHFAHLSQHGLLEEPLNQDHWLRDLVFVYRLLECADSSALCPNPAVKPESGDKSPHSTPATEET